VLVGGLAVPRKLLDLIAKGFWPETGQAVNQPELLPPEVVSSLFPGEHQISLYSPPFQTVNQEVAEGSHFWTSEVAAPDQIDFDLTTVIADFGYGSDAPIVLDYRNNRDEPRVMRLRYSRGPGPRTRWVSIADTFDGFARLLGLKQAWAGHARIFPQGGPICEVWVAGEAEQRPHRCLNPVATVGLRIAYPWSFVPLEVADRDLTTGYACQEHVGQLVPDPPDLRPEMSRWLESTRAQLAVQSRPDP
jgi:hypothetical protein